MNQGAAADRRGKKKRHLRLGENQRAAGVGENPSARHEQEENGQANGLEEKRVKGEGAGWRARAAEEETEKVAVEIEQTKERADQILGLLEPLQSGLRAVNEGTGDEKDEGLNHGVGLGSSSVARRKMSSSRPPSDSSENFWRTSSSVPSIILRPPLRMSRCVQISSTRCNR